MLHICMREQDVFIPKAHMLTSGQVIPAHIADGTDTSSGSASLSEDPALHEGKYFWIIVAVHS